MTEFEKRDFTEEELAELITSRDEEEIRALFAAARKQRQAVQGDKIFAYGFV